MLIWSFLVPVLTCIILWIWFRNYTVWWEYLIVFIPSILSSLLVDLIIKEAKVSDHRYTSEVVVSLRHYEEWNEYVHRKCSRTIRSGKHVRTIIYDCSYVKTNPEYWEMSTRSGKKEVIEKELYDYYRKLWGTPEKYIDMHRKYFTKDGDAQEYRWCGDKEHTLTLGDSEHYKNFFKLSGSLYTQEKLSDKLIDSLKLPGHPISGYTGRKGFWIYDQNPIIGAIKVDEETRRYARWINSQDKKFRVYLVYFKNKTIQNARYLEKYWQKGKDNEVIFCIGLDKYSRKSWIYSFSWSPEPLLENYVKLESKTGTPKELLNLSWKAYKLGYWKPRDFKDYSYITVDLSSGDYAWIFWITVIINILISIWVIKNDYKVKRF